MVFFDRYLPEAQTLVDSTDFSVIPPIGSTSALDAKPELLKVFDTTSTADIFSTPPPIISDFEAMIHTVLTEDATVLPSVIRFWPPVVDSRGPVIKPLLIYIMTLIHDSTNPLCVVHWVLSRFAPKDWHRFSSATNEILSVVSMKKGKNKVTYYYLDRDNFLRIDESHGHHIKNTLNAKVASSSVKGKTVSVALESVEVKKFTPNSVDSWSAIPPFPLGLAGLEGPFPRPVLAALYQGLVSDDLLIVQSLIQGGVVPLTEGIPVIGALLDVFTHAGKIDQFLATLVGLEFSKEELERTTVVRGNSHLTNLFKEFFRRYGRGFHDRFLTRIVRYIEETGNIGLLDPDTAKKDRAETVLFTVLKLILATSSAIPLEIRHLASILKAAATTRFNDKQATYNTLAGFFCLRFVTATIADPGIFAKEPPTTVTDDILTVLMPFSTLLQTPINLIPLEGRMEAFAGFNKRLEKHVWPKLVDFILSVADLPEKPTYKPPSEKRLLKSLSLILAKLSQRFGPFRDQYVRWSSEKPRFPPIGWNVAAFLTAFFEENI
jgi:hypothetical protein